MFTVTVKTKNSVFKKEYTDKIRADAALADAGIVLPNFCGRNGTCGKCKILLNGEECLACKSYIYTDSVINYTKKNLAIQGILTGTVSNFIKNPIVHHGYGAAIDIGTTTIAGYIYKFPECALVKATCVQNGQVIFGADVISRINYFLDGNGTELKSAVCKSILEIIKGFEVNKLVICGNTAMLHFLMEDEPSSLCTAPYETDNLFGKWADNAYLMRCISAFVGADITAAMIASGIETNTTALLVDIGTNGEMVLKNKNEILCCSTAAGPCFEGAGISCGTSAVFGAIDKVFLKDGKIKFSTIGGEQPRGICGSGLVDAIAVLLETDIIDSSGYMENNYYFGDSEIYLSPQDIRNFQLAKSAVRSGIDSLINATGVDYKDIEHFYIAGGFGTFLNIKSAVATGLIPKELAEKAEPIGNAAGMGASMVLLRKEFLEESERLAKSTKSLNLAASTCFMEKYIENMAF